MNNNRFAFFREFLRNPAQIGSIIPSSRFLERRILEAAGLTSARTVVELGPGTGGTTRALLRAMPQQARLLSIEINPDFHAWVSSIRDDRLIAHLGSACDLREIMALYELESPDVVISGIPFSTMSHSEGSRVLEAVSSLLPPHGKFVAYQMRDRVAILGRSYLGSEKSVLEICNIPPMRIYQWEKQVD
ncbi:MAG: class I SAM-dependent methyltransferase [Desulfurivibrionaceae bacterium]